MSGKLVSLILSKNIPKGKLLLTALASHCYGDKLDCWPSVPLLARECQMTERGVYKMLRRLKRLGFLTSEGKGGRGKRTTYTLHPDVMPKNPEPQFTLSGGNPEPQFTETLNHSSLNPELQDSPLLMEPVRTGKSNRKSFVQPTLEEVTGYCHERGKGVDPEKFFAYYEANGWKVGRNPMKDWRAAVRLWEHNEKNNGNGNRGSHGYETAQERRVRKNREACERAAANLHIVANNR